MSNMTVNRPLLLDLFCGAGGAAMGYHRAGFDVIGIDIAPQSNYPFKFVQEDVFEFLTLIEDLPDAFHASPPCQNYLNLGNVNRKLGRNYAHPDLIAPTRELLQQTGIPYIIENVVGAPLLEPEQICGTGLNLPLRRHRLFESNIPITGIPCAHARFTEPKYWTSWRPNGEHRLSPVVQIYGNAGGREHWPAVMGINWMTSKEMCQAIPPAYTRHIGAQLMQTLQMAT